MQEQVPLPNHSVNPREFSLNRDRLICCKLDEITSKFPFNRCQLFLHLLRARGLHHAENICSAPVKLQKR